MFLQFRRKDVNFFGYYSLKSRHVCVNTVNAGEGRCYGNILYIKWYKANNNSNIIITDYCDTSCTIAALKQIQNERLTRKTTHWDKCITNHTENCYTYSPQTNVISSSESVYHADSKPTVTWCVETYVSTAMVKHNWVDKILQFALKELTKQKCNILVTRAFLCTICDDMISWQIFPWEMLNSERVSSVIATIATKYVVLLTNHSRGPNVCYNLFGCDRKNNTIVMYKGTYK